MLKQLLKTKDILVLRIFACGLFITLLLTSCSTLSPTNQVPTVKRSWQERQHLLHQMKRFHITGKLAFKTAADAGSATLNWNEKPGQYTLALFAPFSSQGVTISSRKGSVSLETADGRRHTANNAEQLMAHELGYQLPIALLKNWIKGIPAPNHPARLQFDQYHRLTQLGQAGWQITYLNYGNFGTLDLPTKINFTSLNLQGKIIIYDWQSN